MSNQTVREPAAAGLDGHVVVVTGASTGLGEQLGRALAGCGAVPVLAARRAGHLRELAEIGRASCRERV